MEYTIPILRGAGELTAAPPLVLANSQWRTIRRPLTHAWLGYLPGSGVLVRMECVERDPKRTATEPQSYVHTDSAVEAFFCFGDARPPLYLNFEANANGILHARSGISRNDRVPITEEEYALAGVRAEILEDRWSAAWTVPLCLIQRLYGMDSLSEGDSFTFNLYKISQDPAIEHYISLNPIDSLFSDFHRPDCFAKAVLRHG